MLSSTAPATPPSFTETPAPRYTAAELRDLHHIANFLTSRELYHIASFLTSHELSRLRSCQRRCRRPTRLRHAQVFHPPPSRPQKPR